MLLYGAVMSMTHGIWESTPNFQMVHGSETTHSSCQFTVVSRRTKAESNSLDALVHIVKLTDLRSFPQREQIL